MNVCVDEVTRIWSTCLNEPYQLVLAVALRYFGNALATGDPQHPDT
jgi:hypothetical protein